MQTSSNLLFFFQSYLKQQIEVPWILLIKHTHLGNLELCALFRASFKSNSENILSCCCFLYFFDKRRLFLAIRSCGHCFAQIWESLKCVHVPDQTTPFKVSSTSSTLLALISASAFTFNKYPHKPYIFWKLISSRLLLIPFKKSKY